VLFESPPLSFVIQSPLAHVGARAVSGAVIVTHPGYPTIK
jgi:hypothetical protein